jgi:acetylornithine deacetylase/succinyl-diaminopimelate desuccinylase-like protein
VGLVHGGTQVNVVPSSCQAFIDRRMLPSEDVEQATAELQTIVDAIMQGYPDAEAWLVPVDYYPPLDTSRESGVARMAHDAVAAVLNSASFVTAPWCSNAGVFSAAGVPSVLFGPGSIRQAHTRDEYIALDALHQAVDVYSDIIRRSGNESYLNGDSAGA